MSVHAERIATPSLRRWRRGARASGGPTERRCTHAVDEKPARPESCKPRDHREPGVRTLTRVAGIHTGSVKYRKCPTHDEERGVKGQPNSHVHFDALNRLSNSTTSGRNATPVGIGPGVIGIFSGYLGVRASAITPPAPGDERMSEA